MKRVALFTAAVFAYGLAATGAVADPPAAGASSPAPSTTPPPKKQDPNDKVICKSNTPSGSRIPGPSICHTKGEWDQMSRAGAAMTVPNGSGYSPH